MDTVKITMPAATDASTVLRTTTRGIMRRVKDDLRFALESGDWDAQLLDSLADSLHTAAGNLRSGGQ